MTPRVSIILPTYNRAEFLPQAFDSIRAQTLTDWELIVVDDGSRDHTASVVQDFQRKLDRPLTYLCQENSGPGLARNAGLDAARGKYLAFFDSDDYWEPNHLADSAQALEANPEVDWVFCPARRVHYETQKVQIDNNFYQGQAPARFLRLHARSVGPLSIIDDPDLLRCVLRGAGMSGLQCAVVRREVFAHLRFPALRICEDRLAQIRAAAMGVRFGYLQSVNVIVHTHDRNVSFAGENRGEASLDPLRAYLTALEALVKELRLSKRELKALKAKLGEERFWNVGYQSLQRGRHAEALSEMSSALRLCPLNLYFWKTYLTTRLKSWFSAVPAVG